jgi:hypothetical protein
MTVIVVTQQTGSRGKEVASGVAVQLGFVLVTQDRIEQLLAEHLGVTKCRVHRLLEGDATIAERWRIGPQRLMRCMGNEITNLAAQSNAVVQGWGATTAFCSMRNVMCVHVRASAQRTPTTSSGARRTMDVTRLCRENCAEMRRWPPARHCDAMECYDLVLDTERMSIDECVEQVRRAAQNPNFLPTRTSQTRPEGSGQEDFCTKRSASALEVRVGGDTIKLTQGMSSEEAIARVEQHLRGRSDRTAIAPTHRSFL